jgi:leucyl/phenylalanyl-tRNA--protein transferase
MVFRLSDDIAFPNPLVYEPEPSGLFAVGGDLSVERLLLAYQNGIFPWYSFRDWDEVHWYCPMDRFVLFPNEIHISHSMRTLLRKKLYHCSLNKRFDEVIQACSEQRIDLEGAWLGPDMIKAYTEMNRRNHAFSVEVWDKDEQLVGGLYGVSIGRCYFGESMFSRVPNGSKIALIHLARLMQRISGSLIDCQFETPHLKSMGGRHISYEEYMSFLKGVEE